MARLEWVRAVSAADIPPQELQGAIRNPDWMQQVCWADEKGPFSTHKAYTDIAYWKGRYYCIFRVGTAHWSNDGHWEIFVSHDSERWCFQQRLDAQADARDPHFLATDERLIALLLDNACSKGGVLQYYCAYTEDGSTWKGPMACAPPGYVLWYPKKHQGTCYTAGYNSEYDVSLFSSRDGLSWNRVATICQTETGAEGETCLYFDQGGRALAIVREGVTLASGWSDMTPNVCKVMECDGLPYDRWYERKLREGLSIEGQQCLAAAGKLYVCGRNFHRNPARRAEIFRQTVLFRFEEDRFIPELVLPGGGDTGYCGMLLRPDGRLLVSYYTGTRERADVMVALVNLGG